MTKQEAFDIFCDEAEITDPIIRELKVKPIFMTAWERCHKDTIIRVCNSLEKVLSKEMLDNLRKAMGE